MATKLKDLLLTNYEHSIFINYNRPEDDSVFEIFGIKPLSYFISLYNMHSFPSLLMGIENIYLIYGTTVEPNYILPDYMAKYIEDYKINVEIIHCNLKEFVKTFPNFCNFCFNSLPKYYSYTQSKKSEIYEKPHISSYLPGSYIHPNLLIGESFDFEYMVESEYLTIIQRLKKCGINTIINVNTEKYPLSVISLLNKNNIEVCSFPLYERSQPIFDHESEQNFEAAVTELNKQLSKKKIVYLHCYVGKNRSVSVAIGFMVKYLKMPLKIACEQVFLKKSYATQYKFMSIVWYWAKQNEEKPIAVCKLLGDTQNICGMISFFGLGFYDVHNLDVIAGRKEVPLSNALDSVEKYWNNLHVQEETEEENIANNCSIC
jgi:hypothetical protein